jgi:hypothetical protein
MMTDSFLNWNYDEEDGHEKAEEDLSRQENERLFFRG